MMKILFRNIVAEVFAALLLCHLMAAQAPAVKATPFSADLQISRANGQDMDGKIYMSPDHVRMELQNQGRQSIVIRDLNKQTSYFLLPAQQMYFETSGNNPMMQHRNFSGLRPLPGDNPCTGRPEDTCKKIAVEQVNGRTCDHWQVTDKQSRTANVWVDQKLRFPVKSVSEGATMELSNIKEGDQDPSLFMIPPGYHKMEGGPMGQGGMRGRMGGRMGQPQTQQNPSQQPPQQ